MPFVYINYQEQLDSSFTDGMVVRFVAHKFNDDTFASLADGIRVQTNFGNLTIKAQVLITLADWEGSVRIYNQTGFRGSVPCNIRRNAIGRVHVLSPGADR